MKKISLLILFFVIATILHWAFMALLGNWDISLNLMLVFTVAVCAFLPPAYGYPTAFMSGLFLDFFGVQLFGQHAFVFTLCAFFVYSLENRLEFTSVVPQMVCVGCLTLFAALGNLILLKVFAGFSAWNGIGPFVGGIVGSVLVAPAIFWLVQHVLAAKNKIY